MTPIQLWIDGLENQYWSIQGRLRGPVNDPQICGNGYCAIGVLCDLFLKHAPEAALAAKARWNDQDFVWEEGGIVCRQSRENAIPGPVLSWWKASHPLDLSHIILFNDFKNGSFHELAMYLRGAAGLAYVS